MIGEGWQPMLKGSISLTGEEGSLQFAMRFIQSAVEDLKSNQPELQATAAVFVFSDSTVSDLGDLRTFAGHCAHYKLDPDYVAKQIWMKLSKTKKKQAMEFLRQAGYVK